MLTERGPLDRSVTSTLPSAVPIPISEAQRAAR